MAPTRVETFELDFSKFYNTINGKIVASGRTSQAINPATKSKLDNVPIATKHDVDEAIVAAQTAFSEWSAVPVAHRKETLEAFADSFGSYTQQFATMMTEESGKPLHDAIEEVQSSSHVIREINKLELKDDTVDTPEQRGSVRYTALGVVAAIIPWNFPLAIAFSKLAPALVTGNTIILKPSPFAPYCILKAVELAQRFFPPGVVQAMHGDEDLGPLLSTHPGIDMISFTGSTGVGRRIMESASKTLKRVNLELGGNDPAVICQSVDVHELAPKIARLAFANSGQICVALKRVYIHESIYAEFCSALVDATRKFTVGNGLDDGVDLGPLQNEMQYNRVNALLDNIRSEKQTVVLGGEPGSSSGFFIQPTIVDNPPDDARIVVEEQFGPILPIMSWSSEEDVIRRANNTEQGLGASVWTNDLEQGDRIARRLRAGMVWVNMHQEIPSDVPAGGIKQSGSGIEGGIEGLKAYCNIQTLLFAKT